MKNDHSDIWLTIILWICLFLGATILVCVGNLIFAPFIAIFQ